MPKSQKSYFSKYFTQIVATLILVLLLLIGLGAALYFEFKHYQSMENRVLKSYETRWQIEHLFSLLKDAETGHRGFVITGDEGYLEHYRESVVNFETQIRTLAALLQDHPVQLENFAELESLARARIAALERGITIRRKGGAVASYQFVLSGLGKHLMDQLRVPLDEMMAQEVTTLQTGMRLAQSRMQRTQIFVVLLFAALIVLVVAGAFLVWRYFNTRETLLAKIRSTMARQQAIFDGAIDGIITLTPSGSIESVNKSAEQMFGYSAGELCRRDISKLIQISSNQDLPFLDRIGATEDALALGLVRELQARHRDGSIIPVDVALGTMELPTGTHLVAIVRDISGRRRVEQMKEDFISTVSHELRTPLTSIAGSLGLLAGGTAGQLSDKAARLVAIANSNSQRLVRLINNVLDIDKIEAGEFKMIIEPLDLREIAKRAIEGMQSFAANYGVKMVLASEISAPVRGDPDRLIQVATNLLANACKFSPKGASVRVSVSRSGNLARFSVEDRGPGVPEEFRSRIFSKFSQAEGDSQAKGGTGLGLVIAREIADLHGGRLWFESKSGEGSTFYLDLPLLEQAPVEQAVSRLFLCEDDEEKGLAVSAILAKAGFTIDLATTAKEARELVSKRSYAVGLIDLNLPGTDSIGLIRALRAKPETRDLPLILLSAVAGSESFEGGLVLVADWTEGPLGPERLKAALEFCLIRRNSERPIILHVDDDPDLQVAAEILEKDAMVIPATTFQTAREMLAAQRPDLVILNLGLADGSGPDLLPELTDKMGRTIPVIIYTAQEANKDLVDRVDAALMKSRIKLELLEKTLNRLIAENETSNAAA